MLLCAAQYRPGQSNGPKAQPQHNTGWDVGCTRRLASSNTGGRKGEGKEEGRGTEARPKRAETMAASCVRPLRSKPDSSVIRPRTASSTKNKGRNEQVIVRQKL